MRFDAPVLLYGAGREARSTRAFLQEVSPETQVYVTVDSGTADIPATTVIPADQLDEALHAQLFGLIVKSPGVSLYKPFFKSARALGIKITSNLNIWADQFAAGRKVIAITGTKGKSTTATLTHLMLTHSGLDAGLAGNVGLAPLDIRDSHEIIVLELSSYQTADMDFAPDFVGLTNLYPEHVDWHGSVDQYFHDKLNLIDRDGKFRVALGSFTRNKNLAEKAIHHNTGRIMLLDPLTEDALAEAVRHSRLKGKHNHENARLAARLAIAAGANLDGVVAGVQAFTPLPHRLEEHALGKLTLVDDSISTTPEATKVALDAYAGRQIALIAGGHDREQDYAELAEKLAPSGVTVLICLPDTGARLATAVRAISPELEVIDASGLETGLQKLAAVRSKFDTVLLSPAAPSYNQFKNFEERGDAFIRLAKAYLAD